MGIFKGFSKKKIALLAFLCFTSVVLIATRLAFNSILDSIMRMELNKRLPIENGTTAFGYWIVPPVPVAFKLYVFDIINPEEVIAGTAKPEVVEKGPYVYKMHLHKRDIVFHDNYTVEYRQPETFFYDRESSVGPETDTFTTINIPFMTTAAMVETYPGVVQAAVDLFFRANGEKTFITKSVWDIWWGYEDPVLTKAAEVFHLLNISSDVITGKFGFYMNRNGTDDGLWNVYSGLDHNYTHYAMIDRWNGLEHQEIWHNNHTNRIVGSADGSMMPPYITKDSKLSVFDSQMQRSMSLTFTKRSSVEGVDCLHFVISPDEFANRGQNDGYCSPDPSHCPPSGILDMTPIAHGAPVSASLPHFVGGDPSLRTHVTGLKPDPEKHLPYYDYHWLTGVSLSAARRYQINLRTKPMKWMEAFKNMADAYMPIMWIDGVADMDKDTIALFRDQIQAMFNALPYIKGAMVAGACLSAFLALVLFLVWRRKGKQGKVKKNSDDLEKKPLLNGHHTPSSLTEGYDNVGNIQG